MACNNCGETNPYYAVQCSTCGADLTGADRAMFAKPGDTKAPPQAGGMEEYYETAVGYKNTDYYLPRFARFDAEGSGATWNWPAFFVSFYWLLYRKMWLWALVYFLLPLPLNLLGLWSQAVYMGASLAYLVAVCIVFPMYANALYHNHVKKKIANAQAYTADRNKQLHLLAAEGGTSAAAWIVLLLVLAVFVIGVLAAIAIPAYQDYALRAKVAQGVVLAEQYQGGVANYMAQNQAWPQTLDDIGGTQPGTGDQNAPAIALGENGAIIVTFLGNSAINGKSLALVPTVGNDGVISWQCRGIDLKPAILPVKCR